MENFYSGKDKIRRICEALKKETINPAKKEVEEIIKNAKNEAESLIEEAKEEIDLMHENSKKNFDRQKEVFQSSLNLAAKQSVLALKEEIEDNLFNKELSSVLSKYMKKEDIIAKIISVVIDALQKEGIDSNLSAIISKDISKENIIGYLTQNVLDKLKDKKITLGDFAGGAQIKILDKNIILDISDEAIKGLISNYVRNDFRSIIFNS